MRLQDPSFSGPVTRNSEALSASLDARLGIGGYFAPRVSVLLIGRRFVFSRLRVSCTSRSLPSASMGNTPIYIVMQSKLPNDLGGLSLMRGYTQDNLDLYLQDYIDDWQGRGACMVNPSSSEVSRTLHQVSETIRGRSHAWPNQAVVSSIDVSTAPATKGDTNSVTWRED